MMTADPGQLAAYRAELLAAGLPEPLADQVVLSAADAAHREQHAPEVVADVDGEGWTPAEGAWLIQEGRARRAAELEAVGR